MYTRFIDKNVNNITAGHMFGFIESQHVIWGVFAFVVNILFVKKSFVFCSGVEVKRWPCMPMSVGWNPSGGKLPSTNHSDLRDAQLGKQ